MNITSRRRLLLLVAAAPALAAAAACGPTADLTGATPAAPPAAEALAAADPAGTGVDPVGGAPVGGAPVGGAPVGNGVTVGSGATPAPGPTKIAIPYPGTPQAYATAVVAAWTGGNLGVLGSLTTAEVQEQLLELPGSLDDAWEFLRCDGTAGSSYCIFANADGDELTLRISHLLLGKAHAAIEVRLDETEFPREGVAYVKEFVGTWQLGNRNRMLALAKPSIVDAVKAPPLNPGYPPAVCCGGGLFQVVVQWGGRSVRFDVGTTLLGTPHAIVGYQPQLAVTGVKAAG